MASVIAVRVALALLAAALAPVRDDEPPRLVPVPLVVTDVRGKSIADLRADDLEITENGTARKISSLEFHGPAPRDITVLLDDYHVSPGSATERVRASIAQFIDRHVRPADRLTVVRPPEHQDAGTTGLAQAQEVVRQFSGRKGDYAPKGTFEAEYLASAPAFAARQRAQIVRAALESVATGMRKASGAKAMIVVTEGFAEGESSRSRTTTLRAIARAARSASVPVYIVNPSGGKDGSSHEAFQAIPAQTGGRLFGPGAALDEAFARIAADLDARYVATFEPSVREDGAFHRIEVRVKRRGAAVRAPSGYWAPFAASHLPPPTGLRTSRLLTPHASGLIQPWLRMAPGNAGRTRVTFAWAPKPSGRRAAQVSLEAITFEGVTLHASSVGPLRSSAGALPVEASFEAPPGPVQISMAIAAESNTLLDTDIRYLDVPHLNTTRPVISAVEFVRPRSLPEFLAMQRDAHVMPTDVRDFHRQDRLLIRVRAFAASGTPDVRVRLLNRMGQPLLVLPLLPPVGGAVQFELPFARYPRGEYRLEVKALSGGEVLTQLLPVRLIG